jgi:hypothetical protein
MAAMSDCLWNFNQNHHDQHPSCIGRPFWPKIHEIQWGQGIKVKTQCRLCRFITTDHFKLYEEVDDILHGPNTATMNMQIANHAYKSSMGYDDYALFAASLNMNCMSRSNYNKLVLKVGKVVSTLGENCIHENRNTLKAIMAHKPECRGQDGKYLIKAQTDTAFNNPLRGCGFSSPGTQSITPTMEDETTKHMLISVQAFNQQCTIGPTCDHSKCGLNLPTNESIDSTERQAARSAFNENISANIQIADLCHDGVTSSRHQAGMNDAAVELGLQIPSSTPCRVHLSRKTSQKIFDCDFSDSVYCNRPKEQHNRFKSALGHAISDRCSLELKLAHEKCPDSMEPFLKQCKRAKLNIMDCFCNDHSECGNSSLVCNGVPDKVPAHLPNRQYLNLSDSDKSEIYNKVIQHKLGPVVTMQQRDLRHTNRAESYHRSTFKLVPKYKTYRRNFIPRCLSAAQTDSVGIMNAVIQLGSATKAPLSAGGKAEGILKNINHRQEYGKNYARTVTFKQRRRKLKMRQAWLKAYRHLSFITGFTTKDHDYN